jgi:hypothetical protein
MPLPRLDSTVIPHSRTPRRSPWGTSATVSGLVPGHGHCRTSHESPSGNGTGSVRNSDSGSPGPGTITGIRPPTRSPAPGHGPRRSAVPRLHVTPSELASRGVPSELGLVDTETVVHSSQRPCCGDRGSGSRQTGARCGHGCRTRTPGTGSVHGPRRCGSLDSPLHRPAVAFGACRASAPARRPAVAWCVQRPHAGSATSGRLDGLLGGCDALLRHGIPGEPHTVLCPSKLERWRHNTVYCTPADARVLVLRGARESRTPRSTSRGESATWGTRGAHGSGACHFAGCVSVAGMSLLLQR